MAVIYRKQVFLTVLPCMLEKEKLSLLFLLQYISGNSIGKQKWGNGYSRSLVSAGDRFQDPVQILKSGDSQVLYIKWHSSIFHC